MKVFRDRLLLASPKPGFLHPIQELLKRNFDLQIATTPEMAGFLCAQWEPGVVIIDGDDDIFTVCHTLREKHGPIIGLIIVATEPSSLKEERAFRSGADHYLSDPLDERGLIWRVQALFQKRLGTLKQARPDLTETAYHSIISLGDLRIYPDNFIVKRGESPLAVSPTQFKLLVTFLSHKDQLLSRDWIKTRVWANAPISSRTIDAQISKLRKILPELDSCVVNVYGKGYVLTAPKKAA